MNRRYIQAEIMPEIDTIIVFLPMGFSKTRARRVLALLDFLGNVGLAFEGSCANKFSLDFFTHKKSVRENLGKSLAGFC